MSMSDGKAEEAGPSSPAIISPETTGMHMFRYGN